MPYAPIVYCFMNKAEHSVLKMRFNTPECITSDSTRKTAVKLAKDCHALAMTTVPPKQ